MTRQNNHKFPMTGIHRYVAGYIRSLPDLTGKTVLDIPCGDGRASDEFMQKGARVIALDLYPCFMKLADLSAEYADLAETIPVEDGSIDYIVCQEGIEHIPNQLNVLEEFNRILKKDGILLLTTPNMSHVRARLSFFLLETDYWKRMPPTEIDSIWFANGNTRKLYFGHLFLLGVQHLQSLITFAGFKVSRRMRTEIGNTSLITGFILYPVFMLCTLLSFMLYRNKNSHIEREEKYRILWKRAQLNLSPKTLFCKHIFWELKKEYALCEVIDRLKEMQRKSEPC